MHGGLLIGAAATFEMHQQRQRCVTGEIAGARDNESLGTRVQVAHGTVTWHVHRPSPPRMDVDLRAEIRVHDRFHQLICSMITSAIAPLTTSQVLPGTRTLSIATVASEGHISTFLLVGWDRGCPRWRTNAWLWPPAFPS